MSGAIAIKFEEVNLNFSMDAYNAFMKNAFKFPKKPGTVVEKDKDGHYPRDPITSATEALQIVYATCLKNLMRQAINQIDYLHLNGSAQDTAPKDTAGRTVFTKNIRVGRWEMRAALPLSIEAYSREDLEFGMIAANMYQLPITIMGAEFIVPKADNQLSKYAKDRR